MSEKPKTPCDCPRCRFKRGEPLTPEEQESLKSADASTIEPFSQEKLGEIFKFLKETLRQDSSRPIPFILLVAVRDGVQEVSNIIELEDKVSLFAPLHNRFVLEQLGAALRQSQDSPSDPDSTETKH